MFVLFVFVVCIQLEKDLELDLTTIRCVEE